MIAISLLFACRSPEPGATPEPPVYPEVYTPETDLEPYEEVRVETETWTPLEDAEETLLYVTKALLHRPGAPVESLEHFEQMRAQIPPLGDGLRLSFLGDIMWIGDNWAHALDPIAPLMAGDLRIGNLETPTSPNVSSEQGALGIYAFNAPPEYLDGLPVDLVQLNNNHSLDAGVGGLEDTVAEVEARGLAQSGVDDHAVIEVQGERVALLSFTWGLNVHEVENPHELYVVPFGHLDEEIDLGPIAEAIEAAQADRVVVLLHWGYEYEYYPDPHFMVLARQIIGLGADLIVGQGPHVVQPPEICHVNQGIEPGVGVCAIEDGGAPREAAVLYSLGNAATTMTTLPCQVGVVATVSLGEGGVTGLGWAPIWSDRSVPEVRPAETEADQEVIDEVMRLSSHLGEGWRLDTADLFR